MSEIRRSSRANKGRNHRLEQEQKEEEELYQKQLIEAKAKYDDRIKISKDSVICLVCGTTDENYDEEADDKEMIQCDSCQTWQHNQCVLSNPKRVPATYKCFICDPEKYKDYAFEIDPTPYVAKWKYLNRKPKNKSNSNVKTTIEENDHGDDDNDYSNDQGDDDENDDHFSEDDQNDIKIDDEEYNSKESKSSRPSSKRRTSSLLPKPEKRKKSITPSIEVPRSRVSSDEIEIKAREAVTKRFEVMFNKLLIGQKIPKETDSTDIIAKKWAKKLEEDLFEVYHDRETGKLTKDYKEGSTRIFVNVKDEKNKKLRHSIINKSLPFIKLVKMPVNELLNPDLKKEKEEAIKESMTQATFEATPVSNIRRTHKGDIVLEKETISETPFDFNVGISIDNDEKKFIKSETHINNERKSSFYHDVGVHNNNNNNNNNNDDDDDDFEDFEDDNDNGGEHSLRNDDGAEDQEGDDGKSYSSLIDDLKEDDDLAQILGETKKKIESNVAAKKTEDIGYDPTKNISKVEKAPQIIWKGQTIFTGVTNFESKLTKIGTTLNNHQFDSCAPWLFESHLPMTIEGRLDFKTADSYVYKAANSRKLILLELTDEGNAKNFLKLFEYFERKMKFGVISLKKSFIKDCYLVPVKSKIPNFFTKIPNLIPIDPSEGKLFIVLIIKQELISSLDELKDISQEPVIAKSSDFKFLSNLNPNELALVTKIFDENPQTKQDPTLLIQYLQNALLNQQQYQES